MPAFRKKTVLVEARQLVGSAREYLEVCEWMVENGYPWVDGTVLPRPKGQQGIYIDPENGKLVVLTGSVFMEASFRDWIVFFPDAPVPNRFVVMKPHAFELIYEAI